MMGWTLAGLCVISALLLIYSIAKSTKATKKEHQAIDLVHIEVMKDINALQESIQNIKLDLEVVMKEAGVQSTPDEILLMREILDLYKRNYSIESIAAMKQVSEEEIKLRLAPYLTSKGERRKVANEI